MRLGAGLRALTAALAVAASVALATGTTGARGAATPTRDGALEQALRELEPGTPMAEIQRLASSAAREPEAATDYLALRAAGGWTSELEPRPRPFSAEQWQLLERTAPLLERRRVVAAVQAGLDRAPLASWREAALELLEGHAMASEVSLLTDLVGDHEELLEPYRETLSAVVRRDIGTFDQLRRLVLATEPLALATIRAVGCSGEPEGVRWLTEQLERAGRTDAALREIGRMARTTALPEADATAAAVRPFLRSESSSRRQHAMRTLAALGDETATPRLVEALEATDSSERRTAYAALAELSGRDLPQRAEVWQAWYLQELRWWREEAPARLEQLDSEDDGVVLAAVRSVSERSLRRDELASRLAPLLKGSPSPAVRAQVCRARARLDSQAGLGALVLALEDPDAAVRERALAALRSITGLELPAERDAWWEALAAG